MPERLVLIGYGGFGRTVEDIVRQTGRYQTLIILDDRAPGAAGDLASFKNYVSPETEFFVAIGNNALRVDLCEQIEQAGGSLALIVHPTAYVSPTAKLGAGSIVMPQAVVNTNTVTGKSCIINCGAVIDHDTVLGEGVHIGLNAVIKADNHVPDFLKADAGCVVQNGFYRQERMK